MNILIFYFSGTGNTSFIAKLIKDKVIEKGNYAEVLPIEIANTEIIKDFDVLFFGFPIYTCRMPEFLKGKIRKFTIPKTKKIALFSTFGITACNGMREVAYYFKSLGFIPIFAKGTKVMGSDELLFIKKNSKRARNVLKKDIQNLPHTREFVSDIANSVNLIKPEISGNIFWNPINKLSFVMKPFEKLFARKFFANDKCTHCGICQAICPMENIEVTNEKVIFGNNCVLCLRCITQCPVEAIQIGTLTENTIRWRGPDGRFNAYKELRPNL